jgi:hypothetical protein
MLLFLMACTPTCEDGQVNDPITGDCVNTWSDPTTPEEALAALAECEYATPGSGLDLIAGCVDDACVGMTLGEFEAELGAADECDANIFEDELIGCEWDSGVFASFLGDNGALPEDGEATMVAARHNYNGSDPDGLALNISLTCYLDVLGEPDDIDYTETDAGLSPWHTQWDGVAAFTDFFGDNYGEVTSLYLHGVD